MFTVVFLTESHRIRAEEEEEDLLDSYSTPAKVRKWKTSRKGETCWNREICIIGSQ